MSTVKFLTLNVRGLRNQEKRRSIFSYLKKQKANFYVLQETFSNLKDERIWSAEWGGQIFYSHGSDHSKGVCLSINKHGGLPWKETKYRNSLVYLMKAVNLVDIYRRIHPKNKTYIYKSKALKLKSRIDFFF